MKIRVFLKDPDAFWEAVTEAVESEVGDIDALSEDEKEPLIESRRNTAFESLDTWVEYNEYVTIEFDTEAKTATVIKQ